MGGRQWVSPPPATQARERRWRCRAGAGPPSVPVSTPRAVPRSSLSARRAAHSLPCLSLSLPRPHSQQELADLQKDPPTSCSAGPAGDDLFHWQVRVAGGRGACARGQVFSTLLPALTRETSARRAPLSLPPSPLSRSSCSTALLARAGHDHGPLGLAILRWRLLRHDPLPAGLPVQAAQGPVPDKGASVRAESERASAEHAAASVCVWRGGACECICCVCALRARVGRLGGPQRPRPAMART